LRQLVEALCAAMAGVVLLLLLGTEILHWPWLAALAAVSVLAGLRTMRRGLPSRYQTAREIDGRLQLHDSLSTAFYFHQPECRRPAREEIRAAQLAEAERLARQADLQQAIPLACPRSLYAMAGLLLVASSLFALRYGFTRSLDLRPPLAAILLDAFHLSSDRRLAADRRNQPTRLDDALKQHGESLDSDADRRNRQQAAPGSSPEAAQAQREDRAASSSQSERGGSKSGTASPAERQSVQGGKPGDASIEQVGRDQNASSQAAAQSDPHGQSSASQRAANSQHESNSLVDRFKDAMANLLSRLKSQPGASQSQQGAANQKGRPNPGQRSSGQGPAESSQMDPSAQSGQAPGDQQGDGAEHAQSGPGKQAGSESERSSRQGQSGIGRQDGNKDIRAAQQMAAMGKISEILGRRSQDLTGEAMVEVASGNQRLQTPYSQQNAAHRDAGGEIHRDEIPLAYQAFVQRYFDEVRKRTR
jgi:hypothetical protein